MKNRFFPILCILCCLFFAIPVCAVSFSDVKNADWFSKSVYDVCDLGYMIGTSDTEFSPKKNITGAEAVTLLARIYADTEGDTATLSQFTEEASPWFAGYINYCMSKGLLSDASIEILNASLDVPLTRAELLYLFSELPDTLFFQINTVDDGMIPDVDTSAYYADAVYRAYRAGITVGVDDKGTFHPTLPISRAEVAAILVRIAAPAKRESITLTLDLKTALNHMPLTPRSTGYAVLDRMVEAVLKKVTTEDMTTYEKLMACYDYLVDNCTYGRSPVSGKYRAIYRQNPYLSPDPARVTSPVAPLVGDDGYYYFYQAVEKHALEAYTAMYAAELLDSLTGWCDHYSSAFAVLCRRIGVECIPVYVNSRLGSEYMPHMTSVIRIGGVDCVFDPQIEAVLVKNTGKNEHDRFMRPLDEMTREYRAWDGLEDCRALIELYTYDESKMQSING